MAERPARTRKFQLRHTEAEREAWDAAAARDGFESLSEWLRDTANERLHRAPLGAVIVSDDVPPGELQLRDGNEVVARIVNLEEAEDAAARLPASPASLDDPAPERSPSFGQHEPPPIGEVLDKMVVPVHVDRLAPAAPAMRVSAGVEAMIGRTLAPQAERSDGEQLARDCRNAEYHWRLQRGERCQYCGGVA